MGVIPQADLEKEVTQTPLVITGEVPTWLKGTLIRNGPVNVTIGFEHIGHWFDGLAMLHAFSFKDGKVSYSNAFLRSDAYKKVFKEKSLKYSGFAQDPCRSLFKSFFTFLLPYEIQNANVNVAKYAEDYVALTEVPLPVRFDPQTLETLGVFDYKDKLLHDKCWESAHPHASHRVIYNYLIDYGMTSHYILWKMESNARHEIAKIPVDKAAYMHSFALTENYVILTQFPFVVKGMDLAFMKKPFIRNFVWEPERGTLFTVIDRHTGKVVANPSTKAFFAFHHANAFEKEGAIYLDIVTYPDADYITENAHSPTRLERFMIKNGEITQETLFDKPCEFPRINDVYDGKPYRYLYLADTSLYKINTASKEVLEWYQEGCLPGEPVFVATPDAREEDSGVVLSLVIEEAKKGSFLLILDAKNFKEMGRVYAPHLIPQGLHGQFL